MTKFYTKRVYEAAESSDGYRVLVDRVWPRGVSKTDAKIDQWSKELAPSTELRKWFNHDADKFSEFKKRYIKELKDNPDLSGVLDELDKQTTVTLVYSARDTEHNQAAVLKDYLAK